jgi:hypothetical protein
MKAGQGNPPLIKDKRHFVEAREKENEKYNPDYNIKPRSYYTNDFSCTAEFENTKIVNNYANIPYSHTAIPKDRYSGYAHHNNNPTQTTKTLTFANVKSNGLKNKEALHSEQSSFLGMKEHNKRPLHVAKNNVLLEKEKFVNVTERNDKPLIDKAVEKKENTAKMGFGNTRAATVSNPPPPVLIDDFTCNEEL